MPGGRPTAVSRTGGASTSFQEPTDGPDQRVVQLAVSGGLSAEDLHRQIMQVRDVALAEERAQLPPPEKRLAAKRPQVAVLPPAGVTLLPVAPSKT